MHDEKWKLLKWRCRRGMRELDLMLIPFFDTHFSELPQQKQADFERMLEESDQDLFNWLRGGVESGDVKYDELVEEIRAFSKKDL